MRGDMGTPVCWHPVCPGTLSLPPLGATVLGGWPLPPQHTQVLVRRGARTHVCTCTCIPHTEARVCAGMLPPTQTRVQIHMHAHTRARSHVCTRPCTRTHPCVHTHKHTCAYMEACTCFQTCTHIRVHVHICTPMHICTRTRVHGRARNPMRTCTDMLKQTQAEAGARTHLCALPCTYILLHVCREAHACAHPCTHTHVGTCTHVHIPSQGCLLKSTRVGK